MEIISKEFKLELLQTQKETLETLVKLVMEQKGELDLIPREEVLKKLKISKETLRQWEKLGLKRYQSPTGRSRKIYYSRSGIYSYLSVR